MAKQHGDIPFRYSFGEGVGPITAAYANITTVSAEEYNQIRRRPRELTPEAAQETVHLGGVALGSAESALLIKHHESKHGQSLEDLRSLVRDNSLASGIPEQDVDQLVNVLLLGVILGREEAAIIEAYSKQGIDDIEAGDCSES